MHQAGTHTHSDKNCGHNTVMKDLKKIIYLFGDEPWNNCQKNERHCKEMLESPTTKIAFTDYMINQTLVISIQVIQKEDISSSI